MTNKEFCEWETEVFGYGYGTGEEHTFTALKGFIETLETEYAGGNELISYDFRKIEAKLGQQVTWLLLTILLHHGVLEYGTSSRFGWVTPEGKEVINFVRNKSVEELCNIKDEYLDSINA